MGKIEELVKKKCDGKVEYKKFCEIAECKKGKQLNKESLLEIGFPVINGGINPSGYWREYNVKKIQ